jgi:hypothetical protein
VFAGFEPQAAEASADIRSLSAASIPKVQGLQVMV